MEKALQRRRATWARLLWTTAAIAVALLPHGAARKLQGVERAPGVAPCVDTSHPVIINNRSGTFVASAATTSTSLGTPGETLILIPEEGGEGEGSSGFGAADTGIVKGGPISYHGGSVMTGDLNMYMVWYGNWSRSNVEDVRTMATLTHMTKYISESKWMDINRQYYYQSGPTKVFTKGRLTYKGSVIVPSQPGATIVTDQQLQDTMAQLIGQRKLPLDPAIGMFLVMTSKELGAVKEGQQFCKDICGYHNRFNYGGALGSGQVKYSFTGTMSRCYKKCSSFTGPTDTTAPNEPNADSMATILAHEIVEVVSDPNFDAWYDDYGNENADICIWRYSNVQYGKRADNSQYRYTHLMGGRPFFIQDNWNPALNANGQQKGCVGSHP